MSNILNEFGRSTAGALVETVIVGPTTIGVTFRGLVSDFGATMANPGANGTIRLQISNDGFVVNIWTIGQIEMDVPGTILKTYDSILELPSTLQFRITFVQTTASELTVEMTGQTQNVNPTTANAPNVKETWLNGVGTTLP
jgi:hypothetical protein